MTVFLMLVMCLGFCSNGDEKRLKFRAFVNVHILLKHLMFSIADNLENVSQSIKKAESEAGRPSGGVALLPVSKTQRPEVLKQAYDLGLRVFGENYLNEALDKQKALAGLLGEKAYQEICWHFIGPVQSNKTRAIAEHFDWLQSLDRLKIAKRLNEQRPSKLPPLSVCIQVNVDEEDSKSGIQLDELGEFASAVSAMKGLTLRGLMAIPKANADSDIQRISFEKMHTAFQKLKKRYPQVDTLSMGMSGDLGAAIEAGSTMVRVGTALFGARPPKN